MITDRHYDARGALVHERTIPAVDTTLFCPNCGECSGMARASHPVHPAQLCGRCYLEARPIRRFFLSLVGYA